MSNVLCGELVKHKETLCNPLQIRKVVNYDLNAEVTRKYFEAQYKAKRFDSPNNKVDTQR